MASTHLNKVLGTDRAPGQKIYRRGTHRTRTPLETLEWVAPMLPTMGITRVANITGLDRIGIPVTMVVRPNSRSLAVSQGKGLNLANARVSGIMESIESFHAERIDRPLKLTDATALKRRERIANLDRMAMSAEHEFHNHARILWIQGTDLLSGDPVWLPYEAVHTDFTLPRQTGSGYFPANTNGLASGNCHAEAIAHALYEVIERDAITLWHLRKAYSDNVVNLNAIADGDCAHVLATLNKANMNVRVWDVTSDVGIPCFHCLIVGNDDQYADPEFGSGCHPDSAVALLRALTEAVQARTTFIAGSRDDFGFTPYSSEARRDRLKACRNLMTEEIQHIDFQPASGENFETVTDDLQWALQRLVQVGIEEVIWVDLSMSEFNIPVARIAVPGLEGAFDGTSGDYVPGRRAERLLSA